MLGERSQTFARQCLPRSLQLVKGAPSAFSLSLVTGVWERYCSWCVQEAQGNQGVPWGVVYEDMEKLAAWPCCPITIQRDQKVQDVFEQHSVQSPPPCFDFEVERLGGISDANLYNPKGKFENNWRLANWMVPCKRADRHSKRTCCPLGPFSCSTLAQTHAGRKVTIILDCLQFVVGHCKTFSMHPFLQGWIEGRLAWCSTGHGQRV